MRKLRNLVALGAGAVALAGTTYWLVVRPWAQDWGTDPGEATRPLPGDDVVPDAPVSDTRAITIEAPASAVWPWLMQMGYGRGGWYSYDAIDMKGASSDRILPDTPPLAVGDIVPTHPSGGFEVKVVEPEHALVLYIDTALVRTQAEAARSSATEASPANVAAAGALMSAAQPTEFAASWAFILEPLGDDRARLVERFRVRFEGDGQPWTKFMLPFMGFGVFVMVRRQLLGIKERVERNQAQPRPAA
jgi:hypothetical protein